MCICVYLGTPLQVMTYFMSSSLSVTFKLWCPKRHLIFQGLIKRTMIVVDIKRFQCSRCQTFQKMRRALDAWRIQLNILYSAGSKVQHSSRTPWENLGSRSPLNIAEYNRMDPAEYRTFAPGSQIFPRSPWRILDLGSGRIFGCIRPYSGGIEKIRVQHVH